MALTGLRIAMAIASAPILSLASAAAGSEPSSLTRSLDHTAEDQALAAQAIARGEPMPVMAHPDPIALLGDDDQGAASSKQLVFDMWRSIVNAGQVELADTMLQPDYRQHSPMLPTGREAFKQIFSAVERQEVPQTVSPPLVTILAEGVLVVMALLEELPEPEGNGVYTTTHFNLFQLEEGRLAAHWHSLQGAPGPQLPPPDAGGPLPVTGAEGARQLALLEAPEPVLAANKRLVFDAWRQVIAAGQPELAPLYFSAAYIEHDPNFGSGLAGLQAQAATRPRRTIGTWLEDPLVAMLAQDDLVVMVTARTHPHPHRHGETYTTSVFEMFRIQDHRIAEHWNGGTRPGGSLGQYAE